jgi:hypothetical protein
MSEAFYRVPTEPRFRDWRAVYADLGGEWEENPFPADAWVSVGRYALTIKCLYSKQFPLVCCWSLHWAAADQAGETDA